MGKRRLTKSARITLAILLAILTFVTCPAGQQLKTVITGKIVDAGTGNPLENAIVFLANTPLGTSSASDGTFRIAFVPVGTFQMVIARVGYARELMNLNVTKAESLYYEIGMKPEPVRTKEVEVYGKRPEEPKPSPLLFFPKDSPGTFCLYGAANTMPIGIFFSDSAFYMYSLESAIVDSEKYIRLWLLYKNLSAFPYDFNSMKCTLLHMRANKDSYRDIRSEPPSVIIPKISGEYAVTQISEDIGNALKRLAVVQTKAVFDETLFDIWGRTGIRQLHIHGRMSPSTEGSLSADLYTIFTGSVNDGILKSHIVDPGGSFNGYVYFPFPGLNWKATASVFPEATEYVYTIEIITQSGSKFIEFVPR